VVLASTAESEDRHTGTYLPNGHIMKILKPSITRLSNLEVEHACVDNLLDIYLSVTRFENLGAMVELLDQGEQTRSSRLINLEDCQLIRLRNDRPMS
jgi:hypothetical protein